jgi:hypothetical protein
MPGGAYFSEQVIAEVRTAGYALRVPHRLSSLAISAECGVNLMDDDRIDD